MTAVELNSVGKSFGAVKVIENVDLRIDEGEFVVFVGPSGCGKSTLLRMIAGLETVSSGTITLGNKDVTHVEPSDRGIAMVFQSYALYPHFNVSENMGFALRLRRQATSAIREKVEKVARSLKLDPLLRRKPAQLSGGQRQRVAIGRAISRDPKVFLFDEPLSNLDAELRGEMRSEFAHLHRRMGTTMIYVTHDQIEAMTLANRIVVLRAGHIEQVGTPKELYDSPANKFVAGFIGSPAMNFISAHRDREGKITVPGVEGLALHSSGGGPSGDINLGLRPDNLRIVAADKSDLTGTVSLVEFLGATCQVHLDLSNGQKVLALHRGALDLEPGQTVGVEFDLSSLHVFGENGAALDIELSPS